MSELANAANASEPPSDLASCQALIRAAGARRSRSSRQASRSRNSASNWKSSASCSATSSTAIAARSGSSAAADQSWLPFENSEEFQAARAEAEAQAEAIVQTYTVERTSPAQEATRRIASQPSASRRADHRGRRRAEDLPDAWRAATHRLRHDRDAGLHAARVARAGEEVSEVCLPGQSGLRRGFARTADLAGRRGSLRHQRGGHDRRGQVVPPSADLPPTGRVRRQRLDAQPFDAA